MNRVMISTADINNDYLRKSITVKLKLLEV